MGDDKFLKQLEQAIQGRKESFERTLLPNLKKQFILYHSSFQILYNIMKKKGLIQEDQYQYEEKISEVSPPPETPFLDSEKQTQLSIRLAAFDMQLDFLINYYQFSIEFLTFKRIKNLIALTKYIKWDKFNTNSDSINTRVFAEYLEKIKNGNDAISIGLIIDGLGQLDRSQQELLQMMKDLTIFNREYFKFQIRNMILPEIDYNRDRALEATDDVVKSIKKQFAETVTGQPFFTELIKEIIEEDFSPAFEGLRRSLIERIQVKEAAKKKKESVSFKKILIDGVRILSSATLQIEDGIRKLNENSQLLENRKMSLGERIVKFFKLLMKGSKHNRVYEVDFFDVSTSTTRTESLDFGMFLDRAQKTARFLANLSNRNTTTYKRLEALPDPDVAEFLTKNLEELQRLHKRFIALDKFFKTEIPKEEKSKIRGIKLEINAIKNTIVKSNQKKHEYTARKEEQEQMRKLGIKNVT